MSDITLTDINSGYNLGKINENFTEVERVVNDEVMHTTGGNNIMSQNVDMNTNRILNLPAPVVSNDAARLADVEGNTALIEQNSDRLQALEESISLGDLVYRRASTTAIEGQTDFSFNATFDTVHALYINGIYQEVVKSYELVQTGGQTLVRTLPLSEGDSVIAVLGQEVEFVTPEQTDFRYIRYQHKAVADEATYVLPINVQRVLDVYVNGVYQTPFFAWEYDVATYTLTYATPLTLDDDVVIVAGDDPENPVVIDSTPVTASSGAPTKAINEWMQDVEDITTLTTTDLIASTKVYEVGDTVTTTGFTTAGDGGGDTWKLTATTGTVSQTPTQLAGPLLNDGLGKQWALVNESLIRYNKALGKSELYPTLKYKDRALLGDASEYGGDGAFDEYSWLGKDDYVAPNGSLQPNLGYMERSATAASYASVGAIGFVGAAHTADMTTGAAIGLVAAAVNDNEVDSVNAWGLYIDAKGYPNAGKATFGAEVAVANLGTYVGPYDISERKTYGMLFAAGADSAVNGTTEDVTFGINFSSNGSKWAQGIAFGSGSLRVETANAESYSDAVVLRNSMQISWQDSVGAGLGHVRSAVTTEATETSMLLGNDNIKFRGANAKTIAQFLNFGDDYLGIQSRDINPRIVASGPSTNIDVRIETKGTGTLDLAGGIAIQTATTPANFTADNYINIKIGGVNYRIPARTGAW